MDKKEGDQKTTLSNRQDLSGKSVLVGLTGRMDSALAAFLLKRQGMNVIGLAIVTCSETITSDGKDLPLCHIQDLDAVKKLCEELDIPFYAFDAQAMYASETLDRLVANKLTGRANNSCFYCSLTRMRALYEKMEVLGADFIATGHYAKNQFNIASKEYYIYSCSDEASDQSFLLAGMPQRILERLLLPLGDLSKKETQAYIRHLGLPVKASRQQEGFCFRSPESARKILSERIPVSLARTGPVEIAKTGQKIGEHQGIIHHYIGEAQPRFEGVPHVEKRYEIVDYDFKSACIKLGTKEELSFRAIQLARASFNQGVDQSSPMVCHVKFKYSNRFLKADLYFKNNQSALLEFEAPVYPLIPGETLVIYDSNSSKSKILGHGVVGQRLPLDQAQDEEALKAKNFRF